MAVSMRVYSHPLREFHTYTYFSYIMEMELAVHGIKQHWSLRFLHKKWYIFPEAKAQKKQQILQHRFDSKEDEYDVVHCISGTTTRMISLMWIWMHDYTTIVGKENEESHGVHEVASSQHNLTSPYYSHERESNENVSEIISHYYKTVRRDSLIRVD